MYRQIRAAEKIMQRYRSQTARHGTQTPHSIAEEIWDELTTKPKLFTPQDFVPADAEKKCIHLREGRAVLIDEPLLGSYGVRVSNQSQYFDTREQAEFLKTVSDVPMSGNIDVPLSPEVCRIAMGKYREQRDGLENLFLTEAATFTSDENLQEKVVKELWKKMAE